jgi:hypothetical protein
MTATVVVLLALSDLRRRWRSWLGLAALAGVVVGLAGACVAGARRTDSAFERFLAGSARSDVVLGDSNDFGITRAVDLAVVAALPEVEKAARASALIAFFESGAGLVFAGELGFTPLAPHDDRLGTEVDTWKILDGRRPDVTAPDEAAIGFLLAEQSGLGVGDRVRLRFPTAASFVGAMISYLGDTPDRVAKGTPVDLSQYQIEGPVVDIQIVGVIAVPGEFPPLPGTTASILHLSPAFYREHGDTLAHQDFLFTRLRPGVDPATFDAKIAPLAGGQALAVISSQANDVNVQRSMHLQSLAIAVLGVLIGTAGSVIIFQGVARQVRPLARTFRPVLALGVMERQLVAARLIIGAVTGLVAATLAVCIEAGLSPLFPLGLAERAEPDPGISFDLPLLAASALATVALVSVAAVATVGDPDVRHSHVRSRTRRWLPVRAGLGISMAFDPGPERAPVRSAVAAIALATATSVVVATFGWSVAHLRDTPAAYGWVGDVRVGSHGQPDFAGVIVAGLSQRSDVDGIAVGTVVRLDVAGTTVDALALDAAGPADVPPVILEGRAPAGPDELVLGGLTLEAVDASVGDIVPVSLGSTTRPMTIVGRSVFPNIGDAGQLGRGARLTFAALARFGVAAPQNILLVNFADVDCCNDQVSQLRASISPLPVVSPTPPTELGGFGGADGLPWITALSIGAFAVTVLVHTVLVSARSHRRRIAVLRCLGLSRRRAVRAHAIQAAALVGAGGVVGAAVGIAAGHILWRAFASSIGVETPAISRVEFIIPSLVIVSTVCSVVAMVPGRLATRNSIIGELRTE